MSDARPPDPTATSPGSRRSIVVGLVGMAISVVALVVVVRSVDIAATADAIAHADAALVALGLLTWTIGVAIRAVRWARLLPPVDGRTVPVRRLLPVMFVGYLGNAVLPARLGEPIRAYLVSRREPVSFGAALGSVALERIVDTAVLAMLAFGAAVAVGSVPAWVLSGTGLAALVGVVVVVALATIGFGPLLPLARWMLQWVPERVRDATMGTLERFAYWSGGAHRRDVVLLASALSVVAWLVDAATMWLMARAVGADLAPAGAILVSTITVLSTAIPSAPAYVGTYELAAVSIAAAVGVPGGLALAMAVLAHVFAVVPSAIAGAISLPFVGRAGLRQISAAAVEQQSTTPGE